MVQIPTILVVEDDRDLLNAIGEALTDEGYPVLLARSGKETIRFLQMGISEIPSVAFIDWIMPEMDGVETAYAIRKLPSLEQLPVYIMTGMSCIPKALDSFVVLHKPFAITEILDIVSLVTTKYAAIG